MQAAQRQLESSDAAIAGVQRKMQDDVLQLEFEERTARRQLMTEARAKVQSGLRAAEVALQQRRDRLRDMLQKEDSALTAECVDRMLRADGDKLEQMRARVAQDRARRDAEARQLAEAKRLQQYRLRIDELRGHRSRLLAQEAVKGQLCQIEERQRLRQLERDEARFWDEVMRKEVQAKMAREEQDAREKADRDREMRETLDKQVAGLARQREEEQRLRQEQMRHNEHVLRQLKLEQQGLAEELEKRRAQLAAELQEQIAVRHRFLDEAKRQEDVVDQTFARLTEEALRREKAQQLDLSGRALYRSWCRCSQASLRREQQLFRENLEEMRRKKMEEECELDRLLAEEQEKLRVRQDTMRAKARAAREQLMEGVLSERAQQLEHRQRQRQLEAEQQRAERELAEQLRRGHEALTLEHQRRRAELQRQYGRELRQQAEVARRLRVSWGAPTWGCKDDDGHQQHSRKRTGDAATGADDGFRKPPKKKVSKQPQQRPDTDAVPTSNRYDVIQDGADDVPPPQQQQQQQGRRVTVALQQQVDGVGVHEASVDQFADTLTAALEGATPHPRPSTFASSALPAEILQDIRTRNRLCKDWRVTRDPQLKRQINSLRRDIKAAIAQHKNRRWAAKLQAFTPDPMLWNAEAERAEVERQWQQGLLEEEAYLRKVQELLALGTAEADYPNHPFLSVIEGQALAQPPGAGDQQAEVGAEESVGGREAAASERAAGDQPEQQQQQQQQQQQPPKQRKEAEGEERQPEWDPRVCHCHDGS
ncbi:trichohyalin-like [Schistocerca serialis cubense]|uniref:trichohyalin-like n=1 Tax=Schistocerca serialis cubense TaxID=2023355 RepID=UPI00214E0B81|nr:trichohyalin-like [Schistocerca serialis cubense]